MTDCCNEAYVQGKEFVGGEIGKIASNSNGGQFVISNCQNKGRIKGNSTVGGIVGSLNVNKKASVKLLKCYNVGDINAINSGSANRSGGIVGQLDITSSNSNNITCNMSQCYNKGNINSNGYAGGIVGLLNPSSDSSGNICNMTIESCYNVGKVTNLEGNYCGGIIGESSVSTLNRGKNAYLTISNCYNAGEVIGKARAGGISGTLSTRRYSSTNTGIPNVTINNCYNMGIIKSSNTKIKTSGIIGNESIDESGKLYLSNCYYEIGTSDYGRTGNSNVGCASTTKNNIISQILLNSNFTEDTNNINNGYPILAWQVETTE